jgi:hypothetical protein
MKYLLSTIYSGLVQSWTIEPTISVLFASVRKLAETSITFLWFQSAAGAVDGCG